MTDSEITRQLTKYKVLLIGDSCIDEYKIGTVDRLSPEAPVPVIKVVNEYNLPGMSSNVKENLVQLGIDPDFITNDQEIKKTRYIDQRSGQHLLRVDEEPKITPWTGHTAFPLNSYDAIVISDYNKGFLLYEQIEHIIKSVRCPVFIDTKKTQLADISAEWAYFKINESEYKNARSLPTNLIVTLGANGAEYNGERYPTKKVEVMDVCGCGDTFLAALTVQFLFTKNIEQAIIFANTAAGVTVQHRGNYAPTYKEIKNA